MSGRDFCKKCRISCRKLCILSNKNCPNVLILRKKLHKRLQRVTGWYTLWWYNESGTATKNISYDEFQQYVRDGYISKVIGYDDNSVEAYVKPQHVGNVFRQDSSRVGKNPLITTEAPSRESLGNFLQKERDDAHFDGSINYEKKRNYFGAILWQILPFAFLIGFWIFMSRA